MSKYRFKTKEEFVQDRLWNNKHNCPKFWSHSGEMNKYLGTDVPDEFNVYCDKKEDFYYDGWFFKSNEYVLKEQQKYFPDLSQHIGRYIRALVDNPNSGSRVYKGDIGKIINKGQVDFPNRKGYSCTCALDKNHLGTKYELLPEDYSPEQEFKQPNIEFIPGKWYKYNGWYIKYKDHVDDIWRSSEQINYSKKYSKIESRFGERDSDDEKILLLDLSEIQEYLPDGHPDKIGSFNFEVGKWYKFLNGSLKFGKYEKIHNPGNRIKFSEVITSTGIYDNKSTYTDLTSNIEPLEDLSEIQKYLPNEHPDKVKNFKPEVGKWYSFNWDYSGKDHIVIAKIKKVEEDYFAVSWRSYSWLDKSYSDSDAYRFKDVSNIKELSIKEIQPYLPIGHPDKITSSKFKKGEYIVLISDGQSTSGTTLVQSDQFIKNNCYKVRENNRFLRPELDSCGIIDNGWECILYNPNKFHKTRNWRYATQEEIDEYERRGKPYDVTELQKKELSMKEIQEECKKRFPIGCTFIAVGSCMHRILKEDSNTYKIVGNNIWAHSGAGCLYKNGKWAELVSLPKQNDLKEEAIKYSEETNATILLASNIKSKELHSTYGNTSLSVKLLSNKTTHLINSVRVISSVNLKIK